MTKSNRIRSGQLIVPEIYVRTLNKSNKLAKVTCLEDLIKLSKLIKISNKECILNFLTVLLILLWAGQVKLNSKLIVERKTGNSQEKVFQQTNTHSILAKFISNNPRCRSLISLNTIKLAIERNNFGIIEEETSNEGFTAAIENAYNMLMMQKGSGSTKGIVYSIETRDIKLRGMNSSTRSKFTSIPTFQPGRLVTTGISLKTLNSDQISEYMDNLSESLIENNEISPEDMPTMTELQADLYEKIESLNIDTNIEDHIFGNISNIPLDNVFNFTRNIDNPKIKIKAELPDIAKTLISSFGNKSDKTDKKTNRNLKD